MRLKTYRQIIATSFAEAMPDSEGRPMANLPFIGRPSNLPILMVQQGGDADYVEIDDEADTFSHLPVNFKVWLLIGDAYEESSIDLIDKLIEVVPTAMRKVLEHPENKIPELGDQPAYPEFQGVSEPQVFEFSGNHFLGVTINISLPIFRFN